MSCTDLKDTLDRIICDENSLLKKAAENGSYKTHIPLEMYEKELEKLQKYFSGLSYVHMYISDVLWEYDLSFTQSSSSYDLEIDWIKSTKKLGYDLRKITAKQHNTNLFEKSLKNESNSLEQQCIIVAKALGKSKTQLHLPRRYDGACPNFETNGYSLTITNGVLYIEWKSTC